MVLVGWFVSIEDRESEGIVRLIGSSRSLPHVFIAVSSMIEVVLEASMEVVVVLGWDGAYNFGGGSLAR
jgi:hypothetical protein